MFLHETTTKLKEGVPCLATGKMQYLPHKMTNQYYSIARGQVTIWFIHSCLYYGHWLARCRETNTAQIMKRGKEARLQQYTWDWLQQSDRAIANPLGSDEMASGTGRVKRRHSFLDEASIVR